MNEKNFNPRSTTKNIIAFGIGISLLAGQTYAAVTDIASSPLGTSSSITVKPNIMFILDDSGSMAWTFMPDSVVNDVSSSCFKNSAYNGVYYDPSRTYTPPVNADGTSFANATFTGAWLDGYKTSSGTLNLSTSFRADIDLGTSGSEPAGAAFYMNYTGSSPATPVVGVCYPNSSYTMVNVTTGTAAAKQNFANWFSYYRARILTMKTTAGQAFQAVTNQFRVGFTTIGYTGTSDTSSGFLTIRDFDTTQKTSWFSKLYGTAPGGSTPLRTALSKVGRIYAGQIGTDPMQYSCQQNYTLLSTDGFWNGGAGYKIDGTTLVGNQDNDIVVTPRPAYEGTGADVIATTTTNSKLYSVTTSGCSGGKKKQQSQTTKTIRTIETNNGFAVSDTTTGPTVGSLTNVTGCLSSGSASLNLPNPNPVVTVSTSNSSTPQNGTADTLADVAAYYYLNDLRPSTGVCNTGVSGADVCANNVPISSDDQATYQHMSTFTLGLGVNGLMQYRSDYKTATTGDFYDVKTGVKNWPVPSPDDPTAVDDLWHAAVNGHGKYFSAKNPGDVTDGINELIATATARIGAGAAAATSNLEPVAGDNFAYIANYRTIQWDGDVQARTIDLGTGQISTTSVWSAQSLLDTKVSTASDTRTIYKYTGSGSTNMNTFIPANFTAAQKTAWFNTSVLSQYAALSATDKASATSDSLINYLRGQTGNQGTLYRDRAHVLGDIVNGKPVYVKKSPFSYSDSGHSSFRSDTGAAGINRKGMVYLAANDGMLHAFEAVTGNELWAFIPTAVMGNLYKLADNNYGTNHQYYVDGSPTAADIKVGGQWKTILVGGLNAGGRSYYALDITDPDNPKALWEYTDTNLGLTNGNPVVTKLTDGTWAAIFGSGYNNVSSGDGVGRLYIVDAGSGALIRTISTGVGSTTTPSGLAKISAWVDNGLVDNTAQRVYGGDLMGNLWRFDVNDLLAPTGYEAFQLAQFTVATGGQPITTQPELGLVDGYPIVFVGTGRYLGASDLSDQKQQSLYAIKDKLDSTGLGNVRTNLVCPLVKQDITITNATDRSTSTNPVDLATQCGWYVDFNPSNASPGERVNVDPKLQLGVLAVATNVPDQSVCITSGTSWLYFFDFAKGTFVSGTPGNKVGQFVGNSTIVGLNTYRLPDGRVITTATTSDDKHPAMGAPDNTGSLGSGKRVSWREIVQ